MPHQIKLSDYEWMLLYERATALQNHVTLRKTFGTYRTSEVFAGNVNCLVTENILEKNERYGYNWTQEGVTYVRCLADIHSPEEINQLLQKYMRRTGRY